MFNRERGRMESEKKMLRLPLIVVLIVSMFVGRGCPILQTGQDNSTAEVAVTVKNSTTVLSNNDNNTSAARAVEVEKDKLNVTGTSKHNCNSPKEQEDMLDCYVTPLDDDDQIEHSPPTTTGPAPTTIIANNTTEANNTKSHTTKVAPDKNKKTDEKEKVDIIPLNRTETVHETTYEVVSTETSHINTSDIDKDSKLVTNRTEISISSVVPLLADKAPSTGSEDIVEEVKSTKQGRNRSMPSGAIALVTAISFAVAIAIVYVGMIVWRRYIEYRYGHRELLVNELEFDTNDLRHFEL